MLREAIVGIILVLSVFMLSGCGTQTNEIETIQDTPSAPLMLDETTDEASGDNNEFFKEYVKATYYLSDTFIDTERALSYEINAGIYADWVIYVVSEYGTQRFWDEEHNKDNYRLAKDSHYNIKSNSKKALSIFEEIIKSAPNDFWRKDIELRMELAKVNVEYAEISVKANEYMYDWERYSLQPRPDTLKAQNSLDTYNDEISPKVGEIIKKQGEIHEAIKAHWGIE